MYCSFFEKSELFVENGDYIFKLLEVTRSFKSFRRHYILFSPEIIHFQNRGLCLGNSDAIREVHNSFARQHLFEVDIRAPEKVSWFCISDEILALAVGPENSLAVFITVVQ